MGNVQVATSGAIELHNRGVISSNTFASGNAGTVEVLADHVLVAGNGAMDFTGIASSTEAGSTGAGGKGTSRPEAWYCWIRAL